MMAYFPLIAFVIFIVWLWRYAVTVPNEEWGDD